MSRLFTNQPLLYTISGATATASLAAILLPRQSRASPDSNMTTMTTTIPSGTSQNLSTSYTATFSVSMTCDSCISSVRSALLSLPGIQSTNFSLSNKLVTTTGTTAPSAIVSAIQSTGRTAILRGSGTGDNTAAVCILETPANVPLKKGDISSVRGLVRLIELDQRITMVDLTVSGLEEGLYQASFRQSGDVSGGVGSVGGIFRGFEGEREGDIGEVRVDKDGRGEMVGEVDWRVWEVVGRGLVVEKVGQGGNGEGAQPANDSVLGVVARSAGVWENEKVVCGCSGKTVWEEREEMVGKGML